MKGFQQPRLMPVVQVNQKIAAAHHIQLRKGRIGQHVLLREHHAFAQPLVDTPATAFLAEVFAPAFGRNIVDRAVGIERLASLGDRVRIQIAGEDLPIDRFRSRAADFLQHHGKREGFFPGGAGGDPEPQRARGRIVRFNHGAQRLVRERGPGILVAEEAGHVDQQIVEQPVQLFVVVAQVIEVIVRRIEPTQVHAAADSAGDGARLVGREIVTGPRFQKREHLGHRLTVQLALGGKVGRSCRKLHDVSAQVADRTHGIHDAGFDGRLRHPAVERGIGRLRHGDAARALDRAQAERAVAARARKDDADRLFARGIGERAHEVIDRHTQAARFGRRLGKQPVIHDREVAVRAEDVDVPRFDRHVFARLDHGQIGRPLQYLGQLAFVIGCEVLEDDEAGVRVAADMFDECLERFDPARRCAHGDDSMIKARQMRVLRNVAFRCPPPSSPKSRPFPLFYLRNRRDPRTISYQRQGSNCS